ncbi:deoxyribonuclease-1-like [Ptychodera flava]|uniref:deoxyribonuclease-1-like n=1 Tax=Ptychodera flava TaxID=63121 RepID=UPI00396AA00E
MARLGCLFTGLLGIICLSVDVRALKIGAFNVKVFGVSKMSKPDVVQVLTDICALYDIIMIQEIRDKSGESIIQLLNEVNSITGNAYSMVISERLGRTSSKEEYCFFYRHGKVSVVDSYHYDDGYPDDGASDTFEREPFIVRFSSPTTVVEDFAIAAIHVKPDDAVAENDALADVYDDIVSRWNLRDVLIAGDLNADCNYVGKGDWSDIRLRTQSRFTWLIGDNADTTVSSTNCAYDRLVVAGPSLPRTVRSGQSQVFYFDTYYGLSYELAYDVSDHYPVELVLR